MINCKIKWANPKYALYIGFNIPTPSEWPSPDTKDNGLTKSWYQSNKEEADLDKTLTSTKIYQPSNLLKQNCFQNEGLQNSSIMKIKSDML